ncbi:MAG: TonB-dependent receptor [Sphingomonas sp.]|uniref:TonB-dependent receptor n=1 Tax=Sphingomonas sp. TaxID=28214 RepID=UPI003F7CDECC
MCIIAKLSIAAGLIAAAVPAAAQEVVVTGSRLSALGGVNSVSSGGGGMPAPVLTLRRTADFAVQAVTVTGDTRDAERRRQEIYDMIKGAIALSGKSGVDLAVGQYIVEPLTMENYRNLTLSNGDRSDSEQVTFLVKTPLSAGADAKTALDRISKFIKAVPTIGRAQMEADGDLTLSVVKPEQYRGAIIDLVATETAASAGKFGPGYGVTVSGLDRSVQWSRASLTEVSLYLPISYDVRPKN